MLPVDFLEFDGHIWNLRQGVAAEEIRGGVVVAEEGFVLGRHNRGELLEVANHKQLHSAEWLGVAAVFAEGVVDGVEQVGTHH